jgi:hypothetical protein
MARIQEETLTIKVSKMFRDTDQDEILVTDDLKSQLEMVLQELVGAGVLVEIYSVN